MIPYFTWNTIALGPLTIHVWGIFAAIGVIAGMLFACRQAKKRGLDTEKFEMMAFWIVVWAFIGARLAHVFFYGPAYYAAHPFEIIAVWNGGLSSFGGFAGAAMVFFWKTRKAPSSQEGAGGVLPRLATADSLMEALPLALGCGRIGCFLIHDHPGTLAYGVGKWVALATPDGPRYDLGLLLGMFDWIFFAVLMILLVRPRKDGFSFALFLLVYAPVRFGLDFLRSYDARYGGLTPAQYGCLVLFGAGAYLSSRIIRTQGGAR